MARPRKNQEDCAETRIKQAFWTLLEDHDLKNITVSMITQKAQCNRGSFYYHYDSMDELLDAVIKEELLLDNGVPRALFNLICKRGNPFEDERFFLHIQRFGLMMDRAGQEYIDTKVKSNVVAMWERVLCENEEPLRLETRLFIEYTTSGLIGLISYLHRAGLLCTSMPEETVKNFKTNSEYLVSSISRTQNIPLDELKQRICNHLRSDDREECRACKGVL